MILEGKTSGLITPGSYNVDNISNNNNTNKSFKLKNKEIQFGLISNELLFEGISNKLPEFLPANNVNDNICNLNPILINKNSNILNNNNSNIDNSINNCNYNPTFNNSIDFFNSILNNTKIQQNKLLIIQKEKNDLLSLNFNFNFNLQFNNIFNNNNKNNIIDNSNNNSIFNDNIKQLNKLVVINKIIKKEKYRELMFNNMDIENFNIKSVFKEAEIISPHSYYKYNSINNNNDIKNVNNSNINKNVKNNSNESKTSFKVTDHKSLTKLIIINIINCFFNQISRSLSRYSPFFQSISRSSKQHLNIKFSFFKLSGFYEFFSFQLPYLEKLVFLQIYQFPINNNNNNNIRNNNQFNNIGFYLNISIPLMVNLYRICVIKTEIIKTIIQKIDKT